MNTIIWQSFTMHKIVTVMRHSFLYNTLKINFQQSGKLCITKNLVYFYGGLFQAFVIYFPSISQLLLYFPKNFLFPNYFSVIYHLFLNNFSLISQRFPYYFSFLDDTSHFSITLPNYFSVISQLFPSKSLDISANWRLNKQTLIT